MYASHAATGYAKVTTNVLGPRSVEHKVFQQTTGLLRAAKEQSASMSRIAAAVHQNTQLWTVLAVDVSSDQNSLPPALRAQIISLAIYSQKTGRAVLRGEADLDSLIEINSAIMAGLEGITDSPEHSERVQ